MGKRGPASHCWHPRIKWAQAHGAREALNPASGSPRKVLPSRRKTMPRPNWN